MPGRSFDGAPPPLDPAGVELRDRLAAHVRTLAVEIGERNLEHKEALELARDRIAKELADLGWTVRLQGYEHRGETFHNVEAVRTGPGAGIVVVGAHYDSVPGSPGAN